MNRIPTERDINVFDSLDEIHAVKHFLGKNLEEAEKLFQANFLSYQEDLMWMGPVAFAYYIIAAMNYLKSPISSDNSDAVNCFGSLIEFKLTYEESSLIPVASAIIETIHLMIADFQRFEIEIWIYGDLKAKLITLSGEIHGKLK
jgi:hypothetical protein